MALLHSIVPWSPLLCLAMVSAAVPNVLCTLQATRLERADAEQARAAALKRGVGPEAAEALTLERKIGEMQIS